jgi:gluconolactonase
MDVSPQMPTRWATSPVRYPDPSIRVLDARFEGYRLNTAAVECLATGYRWVEGPVCSATIEHWYGATSPTMR